MGNRKSKNPPEKQVIPLSERMRYVNAILREFGAGMLEGEQESGKVPFKSVLKKPSMGCENDINTAAGSESEAYNQCPHCGHRIMTLGMDEYVKAFWESRETQRAWELSVSCTACHAVCRFTEESLVAAIESHRKTKTFRNILAFLTLFLMMSRPWPALVMFAITMFADYLVALRRKELLRLE